MQPVIEPSPVSRPAFDLKASTETTSPTWELELFLSGALVFTALKLPSVVASLFSRVQPHVAGSTRAIVTSAELYSKAIAYTLLITFAVHLIGRAQWIALMGLRSVFPRGVRWDQVKTGPIGRKLYEDRTPVLGVAIARLDNFCSVLFSVGILFVVVFVYSATLLGTLAGLAWMAGRGLSGGDYIGWYFLGFVVLVIAVVATGAILDKRFGSQLVPDSRAYRIVRLLLRMAMAISVIRVAGPAIWTLATNIGTKKTTIVLYVGLVGIIALSAGDELLRQGTIGLANYEYFGRSRSHSVSSVHYENQQSPGASRPEPMIQSDIIRDPYVRLFVPYSPDRDNAGIKRTCPQLTPLQAEGVHFGIDNGVADSLAVRVLDCLARLHAITLDGASVAGLDWFFSENGRTGLRGVSTYIPIDSLRPGRHVITVTPVPPRRIRDSASMLSQPYIIPFWK